jgi:hypothetical protein
MWSRRSEGTRAARAVLVAACVVLAPRVSAEPAAPIVSYREVLGEVGEADAGPALQVFADGRVSVHYPPYMKRAGDYQLRLTPGQVTALVHSLTDKGLLDFDSAAVRRSAADARQARRRASTLRGEPATATFVSDASTSIIDLHVGARRNKITWQGLREDARANPEITALQNAAAAEVELRSLLERPDLERVR